MEPRKILYLLLILGLVVLPAACTGQESDNNSDGTDDNSTKTETPVRASRSTDSVNNLSTAEQRPGTKVETMSVEGEQQQVTLQLFDQESLPFTTYIPANDFVAEPGSSDEGTGVRFFYSPDKTRNESAYVHIFQPATPTGLQEIEKQILGESGLLETNNWQVQDRTDVVAYPWAKERINYVARSGADNITGSIYLGEHEGSAFYVLTSYPAEYGDGFAPRAEMILQNLEFKS